MAASPDAATDLPRPATPLIGREHELADLATLFRESGVRLVTLTGPGGIGKTRLSLELARSLAQDYADGARFVDLSPLTVPSLVPAAVAAATGVALSGQADAIAELTASLAGRQMLLLLDNFEHLVEASGLVAALLRDCPAIALIVTSREMLRLSSEHAYALPPLDAGEDDASDAVRLFVARANAVKANFALTPDSTATVAEICRRLDGLPLAIELAAARSNLLTPQALLTRLARRLDLLTAGPRDRPTRQQTIRDAIAWSYDLLTPAEQALLRALAVFTGGFTFDAAEQVIGDGSWVTEGLGARDWGLGLDDQSRPQSLAPIPQPPVFDLIASLVDKSLLRQLEGPDGETRLAMLETIRDFGLERLTRHGEAPAVRDRHLGWAATFAESIDPLLAGANQHIGLITVDAELGNLRAALQWAADRPDPGRGLCVAGALGRFWEMRSLITEGRGWLDRFLAAAPDAPLADRARAFTVAGRLAELQGDWEIAHDGYASALALRRQLDDRPGEAQALSHLGGTLTGRGDYTGSARANEQSLAIYRELGDRPGIARALLRLGAVAFRLGEFDRATEIWSEGLEIQRALGDLYEQSSFLNNLGLIATRNGELERAQRLLEEDLAICRQVGDRRGIAIGLLNLAPVAHGRGENDYADRLLTEARVLFEELGDRQGQVITFSNLGTVAYDRAAYGESTLLYQQGMALAEQIGDRRGIALAGANLGGVAWTLGDLADAEDHFTRSRTIYDDTGDLSGSAGAEVKLAAVLLARGEIARARETLRHALEKLQTLDLPAETTIGLESAALLASGSGDHSRAAHLLGRADAIRAAAELAPSAWDADRFTQLRAELQANLGPSFEPTLAAGRELTTATAIAEARSESPSTPASTSTAAPALSTAAYGLTPREMEVLRLVVEGRPDREIAEILFLSPRTVGGHVTNILNKLGVNSRSAATALAVRQGIV